MVSPFLQVTHAQPLNTCNELKSKILRNHIKCGLKKELKQHYISNPAAAHASMVAFQVRKQTITTLGVAFPRSFIPMHMVTHSRTQGSRGKLRVAVR